jgi:hypothetical protein
MLMQDSAAESGNSSGSFRNSDLIWKEKHLDGDLRNVSVEAILQKMSAIVGFELIMKGNASRTVDISFNHLTLDQCIKKLMRLANCNYAIVWDSQESSSITKLIVYPSDSSCGVGRSPGGHYRSPRVPAHSGSRNNYRVLPRPPLSPEIGGEEPVDEPEEVLTQEHEEGLAQEGGQESTRQDRRQPVPDNEEADHFEGSKEDLRNFVEKMADENQLDPEEYERIRREMEGQQQ